MANEYLNRRDQMFPRLTPAQIARVAGIGERRQVKAGEVLFELGEQNTLLLRRGRGGLEIVRLSRRTRGARHPARPGRVHGRDQHALGAAATWCAAASSRTARSSSSTASTCARLVQRDSELSEILMRAFILRRVAWSRRAPATWCSSARATRRRRCSCKEFLTRNGAAVHATRTSKPSPTCRRCSIAFRSGSTRSRSCSARAGTCCGTRPSRGWPRRSA